MCGKVKHFPKYVKSTTKKCHRLKTSYLCAQTPLCLPTYQHSMAWPACKEIPNRQTTKHRGSLFLSSIPAGSNRFDMKSYLNTTQMDSILFSVENGLATLKLNRPKVYNSFNREMALLMQQYLRQCIEEQEGTPPVRAILITGEGKAFSAGQDLQEIVAENGPNISTILSEHYNPIIKLIREIEKPVICAVNGVAAGAGANIALACDIVLAAESASFIQAFSKIGLIPDSGGTFFLPRLIGLQRAAALMMTGEKVPARKAEEMGMIYRCLPDKKLMKEALALAQQLAQMPTKGLGLTKRALNRSLESSLDKQLAMEEELQIAASQTQDFQEGVQAFLEKRKPSFQGK